MKVLSLTEPYATLIYEGIKKIETRNWKTNYRGKLYIHASSTKIPKKYKDKKEIMSLIESKELNFGKIICSCELVDCIEMTKEFIDNLKENNYIEYITGEYEIGRYAWVLKDVKKLDKKIEVKGHLGVWEYKEIKD